MLGRDETLPFYRPAITASPTETRGLESPLINSTPCSASESLQIRSQNGSEPLSTAYQR